MSEQQINHQKKLQMHCCSAVVLVSALMYTEEISMRFDKILFFANGEK